MRLGGAVRPNGLGFPAIPSPRPALVALLFAAAVPAWPTGSTAWEDSRFVPVRPGHGHPRKAIAQRRVIVAPPPVVAKVIIIDRRPKFFHHPRPVIIIPSPLMSVSTPAPALQPVPSPPAYVPPPPPPPPAAQPPSYLRLDIRPDDTEIYLDSRFLGRAADLRGSSLVAVAPGKHLLEFRRLGSTVVRDIDFPPGTTVIVVQDWSLPG